MWIHNIGKMLISSVFVVAVYTTEFFKLDPWSMILISLFLIIGIQFLLYKRKEMVQTLFVQSVILSVLVSFSMAFIFGFIEGADVVQIITVGFVTLPTVLIYDAVVTTFS